MSNSTPTVDPTPEAAEAPMRPPPMLRFGLRSLLVGVAGFSLLFAVMKWLGFVGATILVWVLLLVAAHVLGNAWGSRAARQASQAVDRVPPPAGTGPLPYAPATQLAGNARLGWVPVALSSLGVVVGGVLGFVVYWWANPPGLGPIGHGLATVSLAIVGGFWGFLASSFLKFALSALHEATREPRQRRN